MLGICQFDAWLILVCLRFLLVLYSCYSVGFVLYSVLWLRLVCLCLLIVAVMVEFVVSDLAVGLRWRQLLPVGVCCYVVWVVALTGNCLLGWLLVACLGCVDVCLLVLMWLFAFSCS